VTVISLFLWLTRRLMHIGRQAIALDRVFAGLVAQGVGIWVGFQAFINMGVNLGCTADQGPDPAVHELRRVGHPDQPGGDRRRLAHRRRKPSD
jgi:hypothetical protein